MKRWLKTYAITVLAGFFFGVPLTAILFISALGHEMMTFGVAESVTITQLERATFLYETSNKFDACCVPWGNLLTDDNSANSATDAHPSNLPFVELGNVSWSSWSEARATLKIVNETDETWILHPGTVQLLASDDATEDPGASTAQCFCPRDWCTEEPIILAPGTTKNQSFTFSTLKKDAAKLRLLMSDAKGSQNVLFDYRLVPMKHAVQQYNEDAP